MTKKEKEALPMTIKSQPKLDSTASSFSEWTVRYKLPNETLELGDKIVRVLDLHKSVDTLGRWKAHHLAELVLAVRDSKGPKKAAAEARLSDLLQKFNHRSDDYFRYSQGYSLDRIMPILDEFLGNSHGSEH